MKKLLSVMAAAMLFLNSFAQETQSAGKPAGQNSFFAEAGGPSIAFSANIDRRFKPSQLGFGARLGVGFVTAYNDQYDPNTGNYIWGDQKSAVTVPFQFNYIFGKDNSPHTFEVGAGATWVSQKLNIMNYYDNDRSQVFGTFTFMYRRQPRTGGFSWRIGFTPLFASGLIQPFGGVSIGYNF